MTVDLEAALRRAYHTYCELHGTEPAAWWHFEPSPLLTHAQQADEDRAAAKGEFLADERAWANGQDMDRAAERAWRKRMEP